MLLLLIASRRLLLLRFDVKMRLLSEAWPENENEKRRLLLLRFVALFLAGRSRFLGSMGQNDIKMVFPRASRSTIARNRSIITIRLDPQP